MDKDALIELMDDGDLVTETDPDGEFADVRQFWTPDPPPYACYNPDCEQTKVFEHGTCPQCGERGEEQPIGVTEVIKL